MTTELRYSPPDTFVPAAPTTPRRQSGRLVGIDIARALALMGMFTQHVFLSDAEGATSTGWVGRVFLEAGGRASVLFFVLSGVSLTMIASRGSASATDGALRRRGGLLLFGGLLLSFLLWPASILQHYGVAFLVAPWLLRLGRRGLGVVTAAGLLGGPVLLLFAGRWTGDVLGLWSGNAGATLISNTWDIAVSGIYPMVLWIGFFTLGMLLGRLDLWDRSTLVGLVGAAMVVAIGVGTISSSLEDRFGIPDFGDVDSVEAGSFTDDDAGDEVFFSDEFGVEPADWRSLYDVSGHSGHIGWTLQTGALAAAVMGFVLLLPARVTSKLAPLAWMGSMSLTAYLVHIVLVTDVFEPFVADAGLSVVTQEWLLLGLIAVMAGICSIFFKLMGAGPLERLLKQLSAGGSRDTGVS